MDRVALYVRVSTEEQKIHGLSIEAQMEALEAWAKAEQVLVVGRYNDAGISARKPASKRPELQRLLSDVKAGRIDMIVFTKLDRWFRNISEYYKVQEVLEAHKVNWKTIHEDYDTSTASGRFKVNIMLSVAQDEADRTSERIKVIFESKLNRNEVISGSVPLGFKLECGHLVPNENETEIVRFIFNEYIATRSYKAVRRSLMKQYGIEYTDRGIKVLLANTRYIGEAYEKADYCPAIIDNPTFELVQRIAKERAQRNGYNNPHRIYLFTGLVFCAECGRRLSAHTIQDKYVYYRCTKNESSQKCIHKKRTSEKVLEEWLLSNLVLEADKFNFRLKEAAKVKPQIDVGKIKRKMEKLKDLYLNDLIDRDAYEKDYTALRAELNSSKELFAPIPQAIDIAALKSELEIYSSLPREGKKEYWSRVISKIVVTNEDDFFVTPFSPYRN